jgi:hypothetical protein
MIHRIGKSFKGLTSWEEENSRTSWVKCPSLLASVPLKHEPQPMYHKFPSTESRAHQIWRIVKHLVVYHKLTITLEGHSYLDDRRKLGNR